MCMDSMACWGRKSDWTFLLLLPYHDGSEACHWAARKRRSATLILCCWPDMEYLFEKSFRRFICVLDDEYNLLLVVRLLVVDVVVVVVVVVVVMEGT